MLLEKLTADAWDEYKNALVTGRNTSKRDKILNDYKKRVADIGNNCPSTIPAATRIFPYMNYYGYLSRLSYETESSTLSSYVGRGSLCGFSRKSAGG